MTVAPTSVDTLVIGAGQAGIAMSEHLSRHGIPHVVLEKNAIAQSWRTGRWDSLVTNGPAWHDRFPGLEYTDFGPDAFVPKDEVAKYFERYAEKINAPIRTHTTVSSVERHPNRAGFKVETSQGVFDAQRVVVATGPFHRPLIPDIAPESEHFAQMHSAHYRNPDQLAPGAVLVIGAGSSGVQIADELLRAGRKVYLSVGPHNRPPRAYRTRDNCWWLGVLGEWEEETRVPGKEHVTIAVSGAHGGRTIDFRELAQRGMTLLGSTRAFDGSRAEFAPDLCKNIALGDENYLELLDKADAYLARTGIHLPEEPEARVKLPDPACMTEPTLALDLADAGVTTIIWATGYAHDFSWLHVDAFDENGKPKHQRGVARAPGIYFVGLPWLSRRGSSFIWGVWHDAKHVADQIQIQRNYLAYHETAKRRSEGE